MCVYSKIFVHDEDNKINCESMFISLSDILGMCFKFVLLYCNEVIIRFSFKALSSKKYMLV